MYTIFRRYIFGDLSIRYWQYIKQAQRGAATETAAFIWVFRYNNESSFHLENDFEINPGSTQTWAHLYNYMGQIWLNGDWIAVNSQEWVL